MSSKRKTGGGGGSGCHGNSRGKGSSGFQELDVVSKRPRNDRHTSASSSSSSSKGKKAANASSTGGGGRQQANSGFTTAHGKPIPPSSRQQHRQLQQYHHPPSFSASRGRFRSVQQIGSEELAAKKIVPIPDLVFDELQECYPYGERVVAARDSVLAAITRGLIRYQPPTSLPASLSSRASRFLYNSDSWRSVLDPICPSEDNLGSRTMSIFAHIDDLRRDNLISLEDAGQRPEYLAGECFLFL